jgi:gliding motility-associated-like protein
VYVGPGRCDIWFPNAFSPDGNGVNDYFKVLTDIRLIDFYLQVFDNWGQKLFETHDPKTGWDGKIKGVLAKPGNYAWQCSYRKTGEAAPVKKKGTVMLIR